MFVLVACFLAPPQPLATHTKLSCVACTPRVGTNTSVFELDDLYMMQRLLPTSDELQHARLFRGDEKLLSKAERFFLVLARDASADASRVCRSFIFMLEFKDKVQEINSDLKTIFTACQELRSSTALKDLLLQARDLVRVITLRVLCCTISTVLCNGQHDL